MAVSVFCSGCNKSYRVKDHLAGKRTRCPAGHVVTVPDLASRNPATSPTAEHNFSGWEVEVSSGSIHRCANIAEIQEMLEAGTLSPNRQVRQVFVGGIKSAWKPARLFARTRFPRFFGAIAGACYALVCFVVVWLFWVINIWPFAVGLTQVSQKDPSQTLVGKLASSISKSALSPLALFVLCVFILIGLFAGIAADSPSTDQEKQASRDLKYANQILKN